MRILVADTETSGLSRNDGVVQLAFIEINPQMEKISAWESLIDPECPISPSASGTHGLVDADVADAPTMQEAMDEILIPQFGSFEDILLVAHNAQFDARMLRGYWGFTAQLCTLKLARKLIPDAPDHKLQTLKFHLGLSSSIEGAHSAMADVEDTLMLLKHLAGLAEMDIFDMMGYSVRPEKLTHMPFGKHKGTPLDELPKQYREWLLTLDDLDDSLRWSLTGEF